MNKSGRSWLRYDHRRSLSFGAKPDRAFGSGTLFLTDPNAHLLRHRDVVRVRLVLFLP
jgi:hypothetical protein